MVFFIRKVVGASTTVKIGHQTQPPELVCPIVPPYNPGWWIDRKDRTLILASTNLVKLQSPNPTKVFPFH